MTMFRQGNDKGTIFVLVDIMGLVAGARIDCRVRNGQYVSEHGGGEREKKFVDMKVDVVGRAEDKVSVSICKWWTGRCANESDGGGRHR